METQERVKKQEPGLQNQMGALLRTFADFASLWMGVMGRVTGRGTAGPFFVGAAPGSVEAPPANSPAPWVATPRLTLDLDSARHLEVSVDLRPRPLDRTFRVHGLHASEPVLSRIQGVAVEAVPEEERVVIRLRVPEEQPPGTYSGIILDERTGLPRGTLCVRVMS